MKELKECLVCGNKDLKVFCDMGQMPLVNNLKNSPDEKDILYPLVVMECLLCMHKQLSVSVDKELMFKNYLYQTGASVQHTNFFMDFVWEEIGFNSPQGRGSVLDIGCNDGSLLDEFLANTWKKAVGIEPSEIEVLNEEIKVIRDFFPTSKIKEKFDIITAFNVFAHNDDPRTFLIEMSKLVKYNGRMYILTTPARIDNFYHEHISYFTPQSMMVLAKISGVEVVSFKRVSMHGESYLFELRNPPKTYKNKGFHLTTPYIAYGASASEIVLFNHLHVKPEYVVDDNPLKQGKFVPGINSPIVSCETLQKDPRDLTIIVAHNLFDEIMEKIKKLRPNKKDVFERLVQ